MEHIAAIKEVWLLLSLVLGGLITAYWKHRNNQNKSSQLLYSELEKLKQQIIKQVSKEVETARDVAEKDKIINGFKLHCPDCYDSYIKNIKNYDK